MAAGSWNRPAKLYGTQPFDFTPRVGRIPPTGGATGQRAINQHHSKPQQNMSTITIQLPTEPSYWGSTATEADVYRIIGNLEMMIRNEFPDVDIDFQHMQEPRGRGIWGDDECLMDSIHQFIQDNWTCAL